MIKSVKLSITALFLIAITMSISLVVAEDGIPQSYKKYKNEKMGFELNHPKTWAISKDGETSVYLHKFLKEQNKVIYISFFLQKNINPKALPIFNWYEEMLVNYRKSGTKPPESKNTKLGGRSAVLIKQEGSLGVGYHYYWNINTDILSMNYYPEEHVIDEINKIISTLRVYETD